ncbi:DUF6233 domain-containing protein [Streptomyces sp. AK010]|uniref:DUF6233 domain-containing protein n=1 Tax=Streptomyces sp. AK010 TaxID=2723074 RepID=UPI0037D991C7
MQKRDGGRGPGRGVVHAVDCQEALAGAPLLTLDRALGAAEHPGTRLCSPCSPCSTSRTSWLSTSRSSRPQLFPVRDLHGGRLGRIVGPWTCDPLPPPPIHPHSRDCRARPAPAAKESIAEVNGAYDQVLALLSGAKA